MWPTRFGATRCLKRRLGPTPRPVTVVAKTGFSFQTSPKATRQSETVNCVVKNTNNVRTSVFALSVMPTNKQTSGIKDTKGPSVFSTGSELGYTVNGTSTRNPGIILRLGISSTNGIRSSFLVLRRDSWSAA